jgi:outer membrane lipoprotein LolB
MMEQYLGWSVPLEVMGSWLLGEPANTLGQDLVATDDRGRVTGLRQGGWEIEFSQYELVNDQWRPKRLNITGAKISIRLVLSLPKPVMGS